MRNKLGYINETWRWLHVGRGWVPTLVCDCELGLLRVPAPVFANLCLCVGGRLRCRENRRNQRRQPPLINRLPAVVLCVRPCIARYSAVYSGRACCLCLWLHSVHRLGLLLLLIPEYTTIALHGCTKSLINKSRGRLVSFCFNPFDVCGLNLQVSAADSPKNAETESKTNVLSRSLLEVRWVVSTGVYTQILIVLGTDII